MRSARALRAVTALLVLPGVVAGLCPAFLVAADLHHGSGSPFGWALIVAGVVLLLWCAGDFFVSGKGTLAPWDPPKRLVIVGLYRLVRNPMYLAVLILLAGWIVVSGSWLVMWYTVVIALGFHLRVVWHEEAWLRRQFGAEWADYSGSVRRWIPRFRPWRGGRGEK